MPMSEEGRKLFKELIEEAEHEIAQSEEYTGQVASIPLVKIHAEDLLAIINGRWDEPCETCTERKS